MERPNRLLDVGLCKNNTLYDNICNERHLRWDCFKQGPGSLIPSPSQAAPRSFAATWHALLVVLMPTVITALV